MEVKVSFKGLSALENKSLFLDSKNIIVKSCEVLISDIELHLFNKEEINALANTNGISVSVYDLVDKMTICIHKSYCNIEYMPTIGSKVKYLTDSIDKMSTELNKIINR